MAVKNYENNYDIVLYSTGCPKCKVLEAKLNNKHIRHQIVTDTDEIIQRGFTSVPVLKVKEHFFNFFDANQWINSEGANLSAN